MNVFIILARCYPFVNTFQLSRPITHMAPMWSLGGPAMTGHLNRVNSFRGFHTIFMLSRRKTVEVHSHLSER